ncbi:MAG TPA: trypsin-like peptidase domain-containing protein [Nocardioidaceae bacterium]|jgi:S1-C subfamily serine protease|nr:trypsin-like peptidase domain-containing protein [Nocardioidaceae bacterium]
MHLSRPVRLFALTAAGAALLAGCSSGGTSGGQAATAPSTTPASAQSEGPNVTEATPEQPAVCHGRSVPDMVGRTEPSVVTVATQNGLGSGIVYRSHFILTDQHVVALQEGQPQTFDTVKISLADGSTIPGKVVGSDLLTDLAVVKVQRDLPPLTFRTSLPRPGETVLAMGSPLGFTSSVTEGIVSALGRDLPAGQSNALPLVDLIQTDAPISPGNSGGALLDTCGHVVGVNEAYIPPQSGAVALGFATPSVIAVPIANQLIEHGQAQHPYLGVQVTDLTPQIAQSLGTKATYGAVVVGVVSGGPAAKAGVQQGDVITALAGHRVESYADLLGELRLTTPGHTVKIRVDRNGTARTLQVTIGSRASNG